MAIYVDIVLIENFIINFFLLYLTGKTIKVKVKYKQLALSSLIGCLYIIFILYYRIKLIYSLPFKISISLVMIIAAFKNFNIMFNLKAEIILLVYSMMLAGMCFFLQFNSNNILYMGENSIYNFTYKKVLISLFILFMIFDRVIVYIRERKMLKQYIYNIEINNNNNSIVKIKAFFDTGNELKETVTNLPVIIVEKIFFPHEINENEKYLIPYVTVDGNKGFLEAFKPQNVYIYDSENKKQLKQAIIALTERKLSKDNDYNALLSRGIFQ